MELTKKDWDRTRELVEKYRRPNGSTNVSAIARELGIQPWATQKRIWSLEFRKTKEEAPPHPFAAEYPLPQAWIDGPTVEIRSRKDNTFCFGAFGDLHAGSKYCRMDVRESLVRLSESRGAQAIFDTGNWIDGENRFNRYDLDVVGMDAQIKFLAKAHSRTPLPIYAVTGDDHEGWYAQREGVDIGRYCESLMREAGHSWTNLGYMESHVRLVNANSGRSAVMAINHPGGGSAYALSYKPQKIIESLEGGEKPAVMLIGHYHKLNAQPIRNVWVIQTGTQQDQSPFMRKRSIEAHVGGVVLTLEQDPRSGSIIGCCPDMRRYYTRGMAGRWSPSGKVAKPPRSYSNG